MICRLIGTKIFHETIFGCGQVGPLGKLHHFLIIKWIWKWFLENGRHFNFASIAFLHSHSDIFFLTYNLHFAFSIWCILCVSHVAPLTTLVTHICRTAKSAVAEHLRVISSDKTPNMMPKPKTIAALNRMSVLAHKFLYKNICLENKVSTYSKMIGRYLSQERSW